MPVAVRMALMRLDAERAMIEALSPLAARLETGLSRLSCFSRMVIRYGTGARPLIVVDLTADSPAEIGEAQAIVAGLGLACEHAAGEQVGAGSAWVVSYPGVRLHFSEREPGGLFAAGAIAIALRV